MLASDSNLKHCLCQRLVSNACSDTHFFRNTIARASNLMKVLPRIARCKKIYTAHLLRFQVLARRNATGFWSARTVAPTMSNSGSTLTGTTSVETRALRNQKSTDINETSETKRIVTFAKSFLRPPLRHATWWAQVPQRLLSPILGRSTNYPEHRY